MMKKFIFKVLSSSMLFLFVTACSSNGLNKYKWGSALEKELNNLNVTEISDIEEDIPSGSNSTVFVKFKGNGEILSAYLSLDYTSKEWELVTLRSYSEDLCYYDKYKKEDIYDINTKKIISKGDNQSNENPNETTNSWNDIYKGMSKNTLAAKFKEAGYEEFADGDVYKYVWGSNLEYSLRFDLELQYVDFSIAGGYSSAYYWTEDTGAIGTCKYDYSKMEAYNDTSCTAEDITELQSLKEGIEKALNKIGLSIRDLNRE